MPGDNPNRTDPLQTVTVIGGPPAPLEQTPEPPRLAKNIPGYELIRELGRGGMGVVYEARQEGLDRIVALKMILNGEHASRDALARFQTEATAIAKLAHPNIVQVHTVGTFDELPYFVLEYCAGGTLSQRLQPGKGMDLESAARLVATLARAVHAAHHAGIVHRDLKPGNILFTKDGTPKVTDFGLAKRLDSDSQTRTRSGAIMGTPSYMSPEQATGKIREIAPSTDVFALGVILYEASTGQRPFVAATSWETLQLISGQDPPRPRKVRPEVPTELEAIILQTLEKDPRKRYASSADLADDLDRWLRGEPVRARGNGLFYRLTKSVAKHRRKLAALGALALLLFLLWFGLSDSGYSVPGAALVQRWLDSHDASILRPAPREATLRSAASDHRSLLRQRLLDMAAARDGWLAPPGQAPDAWTQMQGTVALFSCHEPSDKNYDKIVRRLDDIFEVSESGSSFNPGFGWAVMGDGNISAEPCAWTLLAIAKTLNLPKHADESSNLRGPSAEERATLLQRLEQVETALDHYRSLDKASGQHTGAWNLFAQQKDPSQGNVYITLIVCQGLIELSRANLAWHGSNETRDRLLHQTTAWLLGRFTGRGWSTPGAVLDQHNDGLSLQIFTTLLEAEAGGYVELPEAVLIAVPQILAESGTRTADYQSPIAVFSAAFRNHRGESVPWAERRMRSVWYAWAVSCGAHWLRRCERTGAPTDELVRTRRLLGHLLLTLAPEIMADADRWETFVTAETLIGLAAVDPP